MINEIPISVVDRKIKVGRHVPATMTNIGKDYLSISLDNEWSSTNHRLRVTLYSEAPYVSVQDLWDGKSAIEIPQEITSCPSFKITIANVSEDGYERLVTQAMDEPIENPRNGHDEGSEPGVRTMDIIARIDNLAADLEQKRDTDYWRGQPGKDADIAGAEAAKDAANKAAKAAIDAAARADSATSNANNAATNANEAADNANNATVNANDATENANKAAEDIRAAAERGDFDGAPGEPGADGYSPTANVTKDGGTATITITDKNGTTTATVSDGAPGKDGSDASATDVRINGTSITVDGVADIPPASYDKLGVVMNGAGIDISTSGVINPKPLMQNMITNRKAGFTYNNNSNDRCAITPSRLDYAVKAAMTDGKGAAWTEKEKLAARERLGIGGSIDITTLTFEEPVNNAKLTFKTPKPYSTLIVQFSIPKTPEDTNFRSCPMYLYVSRQDGSDEKSMYTWIGIPNISNSRLYFVGLLSNDNGLWTWQVKGPIDNDYYANSAWIMQLPSYKNPADFIVKERPYVKRIEIGWVSQAFPAGSSITAYGVL